MMESSESKRFMAASNGSSDAKVMMLEMEDDHHHHSKDDESNNININSTSATTTIGSPEEHSIPTVDGTSAAKKRSGNKTLLLRRGEAKGAPLMKRKTKQTKSHSSSEATTAMIIKYAALFLLVAQMVGLVLLMRLSRTTTLHKKNSADDPLYLASTAVFLMEVMKFVLCCMVITYQSGGQLGRELIHHVWQSPMEMLKLCVPSLLYTVQNNLLYLALTNLDAATYQVCYQLKILTTALFSVTLLQRQFSKAKWAALVLLTIGVAIVQVSGSSHSSSSSHHHDPESNSAAEVSSDQHHRFIGLVAVLCAACTSGFSGVYFEKILKGSDTSLWMRNVQMGLPSMIIAYATIYLQDAQAVATQGMLGGYTTLVWIVVAVQAVGGLIVAVVVKYADNVLKVFATSFSIVISCIIAAMMHDFHPNVSFMVGATCVVLATAMYSAPEPTKRKPVLPLVMAHHATTSTTTISSSGSKPSPRKSSLVM